ncbi:MAG: hypothetical protein ACTS3T_20530 [Almyronema sp.]
MNTNPVLIDARWLSTDRVDSLAEDQQDWICWLNPDREIQLYNFSLLGVEAANQPSQGSLTTVAHLIALTRPACGHRVALSQRTYWSYSCCLQTIGWGRVRLVVCTDQSQPSGASAAFATNRLDWSPRNVLTQWNQHYPLINCFGHQIDLKAYHNHTARLVVLS